MAKVRIKLVEDDKTGFATMQHLLKTNALGKNVCTVVETSVEGDELVVQLELTCKQLDACYNRAGYGEHETLGINNQESTYLIEDDNKGGYLVCHFYLDFKHDMLCAEYGGMPIMEFDEQPEDDDE